ncbi:MAG: DUF1295 domain-containing protein [Candidatus Thorarchaeota archaeon]|nr:DUF1295 domain-containing protein [Candidatus Thorarchaeota archaeon]
MHKHKKHGLVTTGLYRRMRHPQYFGMLLVTIGFTAQSYVLQMTTFGISWIEPPMMIATWYSILFIYVILALVEESYLSKRYGQEYEEYKRNSGFFVPRVGVQRESINTIASIIIMILLLNVSIAIGFAFVFGAG